MSDLTCGLLEWLRGVSTGPLITLRAETTPSPTHRPRFSKAGFTFYAKSYQLYSADCQKAFAVQVQEPLTGRLACVVETVCLRPKTTKLTEPKADSDNLAKGPLDAATKAGVWGDDSQIVPMASTKRWTQPGEAAGVMLHIGRLP